MSEDPSRRQLRVAIIGAGVGIRYAESFQRLPGAEVVALCATTKTRAAPAADRLRIPHVYTDVEKMLVERTPDVVAIAAPNDLHYELTLTALEAGAHVLCDKPLALTVDQARLMLETAERRQRRHIIPFWWHFVPAVARARLLSSAHELGEPYFASVRYVNRGWGDPRGPMRWQFERERAGSGALGNVGSHAIHVLHTLVGRLTRVCATSAINVPVRDWPCGKSARPDVEDTVAFVGELANGAPVSVIASSVAHEHTLFDVLIQFKNSTLEVAARSHWDDFPAGRLSLTPYDNGEPHQEALGAIEHSDSHLAEALSPQDRAYTAIASELITAIHEERQARPNFADGLRVQQVIDAVLESLRRNTWAAVGT